MEGVANMKRMISLLLMVLLALTMAVGCGGEKEITANQTPKETESVETGEETGEDETVAKKMKRKKWTHQSLEYL